MRFWLERGVDGFRIDVAHGMAKPPGLPDAKEDVKVLSHSDDDPRFNNPSVHEIHRGIRKIVDEYPDAVTIGEVWVMDNALWAEYLRPDELHLGFNFRLTKIDFDAGEIRSAIENSLAATGLQDAVPTWTLSDHDVDREVTRYGGGEIGLRRARAMAMAMLALPGTVFIYNGEELGLPDVWTCPRRCCRTRPGSGPGTPNAAATSAVFRFHGRARLPRSGSRRQPTRRCRCRRVGGADGGKAKGDPDSTLSFFQKALELRRKRMRNRRR